MKSITRPISPSVLGKQPPFTDYGAERWRNVDTSKDPTGFCLPPGPSRGLTAPFPFLLVQHHDAIAILFEYQGDLAGDLPGWPPASRGRLGVSLLHGTFNRKVGRHHAGRRDRRHRRAHAGWIKAGHEHSAELRLTERFQKTDADTIQWTATFDDPVFFTRPWSVTRTFRKRQASSIESFRMRATRTTRTSNICDPISRI